MAFCQNPITGTMKGTYADTVFFDRLGKHCARPKPTSVKNPKTPAQQANRMKFKEITHFSRKFLPLIRRTFINEAVNAIPYNKFVKSNYEQKVIVGDFPHYKIDYSC